MATKVLLSNLPIRREEALFWVLALAEHEYDFKNDPRAGRFILINKLHLFTRYAMHDVVPARLLTAPTRILGIACKQIECVNNNKKTTRGPFLKS